MKILICNTAAVTLDGERSILPEVDIAIEDGRILSVGNTPGDFKAERVIDGSGYAASPGFFNTHTHSAMTLERGWAEDLPFDRWLNEKIWVAEGALEKEDVYWGAALACCEMIRSGTVGFADHYFWMDETARAVSESGMKALLAWCQFGIGKDKEVGGITLEDTVDFIKKYHNSEEGRIKCFLGPHSPYMCPPDFLKKIVKAAGDLNVGIHLHLSESDDQVKNSLKAYNKTPVEHLKSLGVFDHNCIAAHCISVSDNDISILAEKKVNIAHTPKTYMKLAMGMAPLDKFINAGINVGLGTDGPASNSDLNMLEVLRITGLVHKNRLLDPSAFPINELLKMAAQAGAKAMGFEDTGVLKPGASADIVLFNTQKTHWAPRHDISANIVYSSHPSDIEYVICNGRIILDKGQIMTFDEEKVKYEAERRAFRMTARPMHLVRSYKA
ncbi:MAG: amidohydrolase [Armatimonadota bacterium]